MIDLPQPLTPADCNLRGLPFMPLMVTQLLQSETFGLSTGDEFKAAFALWCASWMEVPAASLPSDDRMLEFLSRSKSWKKVKAVAMRGWVPCSDGRLYHPVIAARALEAWEKRTEYREKEDSKTSRQQRWREQCKQLATQLRELGITPPKGASLEKLKALLESHGVDDKTSTDVDGEASTGDAGEIGKRETVKRQGQLTSKALSGDANDSDREHVHEAPLPPREDPKEDENNPAIALAVDLRKLGVNATFTHPAVLDWAKREEVTRDILVAAVAKARETKGNAKIVPNYLVPIVEELLHPPAKTEAAAPKQREDYAWASSNQGIDAKARELGIRVLPSHSYPDVKQLCFDEIRKRKGQP